MAKGKKTKVKAKVKPKTKAASKKVVKLKATKPTTKKVVANGLPKPSAEPWGEAGKALDGVRVLDFTHVQSGPTCTQLLAYMGADVIKVERPGVGDITRGQLRDVKGADSLYFTMLNGNKRSITIDSKHPKGKEILDRLIKHCDVLVENFAPGALDRMGLTWEHIHKTNPRMIAAARPPRPASATGRRSSPVRRLAIPAPACISLSVSSALSISASALAAASACSLPCRMAC
jgi:formyl-CoA transferase